MVPVSALKGDGIDDLLENILVVSEISEYKADPSKPATGTVVEAKLDKNPGPLGNPLGAVRYPCGFGDYVTAGTTGGKVRAWPRTWARG